MSRDAGVAHHTRVVDVADLRLVRTRVLGRERGCTTLRVQNPPAGRRRGRRLRARGIDVHLRVFAVLHQSECEFVSTPAGLYLSPLAVRVWATRNEAHNRLVTPRSVTVIPAFGSFPPCCHVSVTLLVAHHLLSSETREKYVRQQASAYAHSKIQYYTGVAFPSFIDNAFRDGRNVTHDDLGQLPFPSFSSLNPI